MDEWSIGWWKDQGMDMGKKRANTTDFCKDN